MREVNGWRVKRAGATMTITHATGKITGVVEVYSFDGQTRAMLKGKKPGEAGEIILLN